MGALCFPQDPPLVRQPCAGYFYPSHGACVLIFLEKIPSFQTKDVLIPEKTVVVAAGI